MTKYKYIGRTEVQINGVGIVKPNEEVATDIVINHPLFIEQKETKQVLKKKKNS